MDGHIEGGPGGETAQAGALVAGARDVVVGVHLYPVKSCRAATVDGAPVPALEVGPTGLRVGEVVDRGWVLAAADGAFVTQRGWDGRRRRRYRDDRLLATVAVDVRRDHLHLSSAGHGEVEVALGGVRGRGGFVRSFDVDLAVTEEDPAAGAFFSELLGRPVRLTRVDLDRPRWLAEQYRRPGAADRSAAADGRPLSLASSASLDRLHDLAGMARGTVPLDRFRANVEIAGHGLGPFGEDRLRTVRIGALEAYVVKALVRCPMPNFDQRTGDDGQHLATRLLRRRSGWAAGDEGSGPPGPYFAQSCNHRLADGDPVVVAVGDPVVAVEVGEPNVVLRR